MSTALWGGTTGKISGSVVDAATGDPLIGANVVILGTSMGAAADAEGDYFIVNIPPGTYEVSVSMIGYQAVTQTEVIVRIDHTTPIDFQLSSTVLQAEAVTVTAEREIVKMDQSSSTISASVDEIAAVPMVTDIDAYMSLQAGILGDNIRGGGLDQTEFMIDGLMVVDNRANQPMTMVNLSAVQEMNIVTGGFNAEYGNVRSGLISVVTKEGSPTSYSGSVDLRYTAPAYKHYGPNVYDPDNYNLRAYLDPAVCYIGTQAASGDSSTWGTPNGGWSEEKRLSNVKWAGWTAYAADDTNITAEQAREQFQWYHLVEAKPEWNVVGAEALGQKVRTYGDLPDVNVDVSLGGPVPIIGKYLGDLSFFVSYFKNLEAYAYPTVLDHEMEENTQIKFTSRLSPSFKIILEGLFGSREWTSIGQSTLYWQAGSTPQSQDRSLIGLGIDHTLSPSTFYNFRVSYFHSENWANAYEDLPVRDTTTIRYFGSYPMDETPWGWSRQLITLLDGQYISGPGPATRDYSYVYTTNIKFDLTSQINKYTQVKTGFEFVNDVLNTHTERDAPCQPDLHSWVIWDHQPYRLGAYIQNKLEFEGMIANVGVRMDYNDPNTEWYTVDVYSDYFTVQKKWLLEEEAPTEAAEGHLKISPRVGISHPITENAKLYFNYGHFHSMASSSNMYTIQYGSPSSGIQSIGNPSVDMPKTVAYELGVDYNIGNLFLIHAGGYYKDVSAQSGTISYQNYDQSVRYSTYTNNNYEDIRGLELRIDKRFGRWMTGWLNYDYMVQTRGDTGRATFYEDISLMRVQGLQDADQLRPLPRPTLRANLILKTPVDFGPIIAGIKPLGGFNFSFVYTWRAGSYMTWDPLETGTLEDNLQWKGEAYTDFRITKAVRFGNYSISVFMDVNNLFDSRYINSAGFSGDSDRRAYYYSLHLPMYEEYEEQGLEGFVGGDDKLGDIKTDDKPYINMPDREHLTFQNPRSIIFGLRASF